MADAPHLASYSTQLNSTLDETRQRQTLLKVQSCRRSDPSLCTIVRSAPGPSSGLYGGRSPAAPEGDFAASCRTAEPVRNRAPSLHVIDWSTSAPSSELIKIRNVFVWQAHDPRRRASWRCVCRSIPLGLQHHPEVLIATEQQDMTAPLRQALGWRRERLGTLK